MQIVVVILKNVSYETQFGICRVENRLGIEFADNGFYNFCITIFRLNSISFVFLKDFLIIFFLNICKQILVI